MRLNSYVLREEIAGVDFKSHIVTAAHELTCSYPALFVPGMQLAPGVVHIARASDLPQVPIKPTTRSSGCPLDLVLIGKPNEGLLASGANMI